VALTLLACPALLLAEQNIVKNGSMESGSGPAGIDPFVADQWTEFGENVERSPTANLEPPGEGHALKSFGDSNSSSAGGSQIITGVGVGDNVTASVWVYTPDFDKLGGSGEAGIVLEFLDQFGGTISLQQLYVLNASSSANTWIEAAVGPLAAPSNTTKVRISCRLKWTPGNISGACYWDDAQVSIESGPNAVLNGDFETAGPSPGQSPVGIDDWTGFNDQEKSSEITAEHGSYTLRLGTDDAYSGLYQNMGTLSAGDQIYLQALVWNPSADPLNGTSIAGIKLEFDANAEVPPAEENLAFDANATADTWTPVTLSTTVPDEATVARIVCIYVGDGGTTGELHFDAVSAERGSAPGVNQLLNASFEDGTGGANGLDGWTEFYSDVSECRKSCLQGTELDGICSARATGTSVAGVYQEIEVTPGESLDIEVNILTPSFAQLTGGGTAGVKVEWAVGGVPGNIDIGGATNTIDAGAPTDTWIPIYIDYTMPEGTSALVRFVNIISKGNALTGTVYFDSCEAVVLNAFDGSDIDGDDDEDTGDYAWLQRTFTGAGGGLVFNGMTFDADDDEDVDVADWNYFVPRFTGPLP